MDIIASHQNENCDGSSLKTKKQTAVKSFQGRNTLSVLQSTENTGGLTRHDPTKQKGKKISQKKNFQIFEDVKKTTTKQEGKKSECIHMEVQTESESCCHCMCHGDEQKEAVSSEEEEARRLMIDDDVPEDYWKQLAESRREALEESLIENEVLHTEMDELKEENRRLSELAEHAEYFANILKSMNTEGTETEQVFDDATPSTSQAADLSENQTDSDENTDKKHTEDIQDSNKEQSHSEEQSDS